MHGKVQRDSPVPELWRHLTNTVEWSEKCDIHAKFHGHLICVRTGD